MKKCIDIFFEDKRRIVKGLGYYKPQPVDNLKDLITESVRNYGEAAAFKFKDKTGQVVGKTYSEFGREIDYLGTSLLSLGLQNSKIAIISENRYEWGLCYLSIINGVGIAVPMDKHLPSNEIFNLIERGKVDAIFYSEAYHQAMIEISRINKNIKYYICIDNINININDTCADNINTCINDTCVDNINTCINDTCVDNINTCINTNINVNDTCINDISAKSDSNYSGEKFLNLNDLINIGKKSLGKGNKNFVNAEIDKDKMSVLLFTSGTTSIAKAVMLSHSNIASNITSLSACIYVGPGDVHLSLLPLHHTFENTVGLLFLVHRGVCIAYSDGIKYIAQNLVEYNVSILIAVPAIFEAMYRKLIKGIEKSEKDKMVNILIKISQLLRCVKIDIRRKLFKSLFKQFGPNLRIAVSGAAPLDSEVIAWFDKIGLNLLQGYGLTETSPVASVNYEFYNKFGTIGFPLAGVEMAIDSPDQDGLGEIIIRGPNVMLGYYENNFDTNEVLDKKGWFKTGDLGIIDEEGYVSVRGRAKSIIVFTNGKKAFPEEYEVLLNDIPEIRESFVWGNPSPTGDIQVCAKLVVDKEDILSKKEKMPSSEILSEKFEKAIREINKTLPQYKIIRYFVMTYEDLSKTTTLKIKRPIEESQITEKLDSLGLDMRKASGKFI